MTPQKYPQNLQTPKNIYFSENPKNIEIQNFEPKKMTRAYVCMKITESPLGVYDHVNVQNKKHNLCNFAHVSFLYVYND